MKTDLETLNELAQKYGYRFNSSAYTSIGCTNMFSPDGEILIGNGSFKQCISIIKKREEVVTPT